MIKDGVTSIRVTSEGSFPFKSPLLATEQRTAQAQLMISRADHILSDYNFHSLCYANTLCGRCVWFCCGLRLIRCLQRVLESIKSEPVITPRRIHLSLRLHQFASNPPIFAEERLILKIMLRWSQINGKACQTVSISYSDFILWSVHVIVLWFMPVFADKFNVTFTIIIIRLACGALDLNLIN